MKNCRIIIEQNEGEHMHKSVFTFDDYRIATAICNILNNVAEYDKETLHLQHIMRDSFVDDGLKYIKGVE